jgi:hypothetical protein
MRYRRDQPGESVGSQSDDASQKLAVATDCAVTDTDRRCALSNSDKLSPLRCVATVNPASAIRANMKTALVEMWRWAMATVVRIDAAAVHRTGGGRVRRVADTCRTWIVLQRRSSSGGIAQ